MRLGIFTGNLAFLVLLVGDMGFDDPEMAREATNIDEAFDQASLLLGGRSSLVPRSSDQRSAAQGSEAGADALSLGPLAPSGNDLDAEERHRDDPFGAQGSAGDMPGEDNLLGKASYQYNARRSGAVYTSLVYL